MAIPNGRSSMKKDSTKQPHVKSAFADHVHKLLSHFLSSQDSVYDFEGKLYGWKRDIVLQTSKSLGLFIKSPEGKHKRCLSVYKRGNIKIDSGGETIPTLNLSTEAKGILTDLFRHYPPHEDEAVEQYICKDVYKSTRKEDDFFCRPEMDSNQIAINMKSLSDRVEKDPKLKQISEKKSKLPIASFQNDIISTIAEHQVVLITGESGCGKTTQVPQLLLDYMWAKGESCKILCTQPRSISAVSVAERVSVERGEIIGENVGYKTRLESKGGRQSSILFCTNRIMLSVLVSEGVDGSQSTRNIFSELTHIIVDEIHERDRHSDFIIAILRDLLPAYPHLRLVLMSATLGAERFSDYFGGCPVIQVPCPTHAVKSFYLDDVLPILDSAGKNHINATSSIGPTEEVNLKEDCHATLDDAIDMETTTNKPTEENMLETYMSTNNPEFIDVNLIEKLLEKICSESTDGAILVFVPGWDDINKTLERLQANSYFQDSSKFMIVPLHSMVSSFELKKVFEQPPPGCRKIVLSADISETSIIIDDVGYVIDSGRMKKKSYDDHYNNSLSILQTLWISQASEKQREECAGRCKPGVCYHLYSKSRAASLEPFQVPEIRRMRVEELCLQVKILNPNCKIEEFLKKTLDCPPTEAINNAIAVLKDIGGLSLDERLTELGEKLGSLPVHPLTGKMLFLAIMLNCLDPALTLSCLAYIKDPFVQATSISKRKKAELASLYGGFSDQLAIIAAFDCWRKAKEMGVEGRFCNDYFICQRGMQMLDRARGLLQTELIRGGFIADDDVSMCSMNARDPGIVRAIVVAALYPMVGKVQSTGEGKHCVMQTVSCDNVRFHPQSLMSSKSLIKSTLGEYPLVVFDEVLSGDSGMLTRNNAAIAVAALYPMVGKVQTPGEGKHCVVQTVNCDNVRFHPQSLTSSKSLITSTLGEHPLVEFDEVISGDSGMLTRNNTAIAPLPLLLLAKEIGVAPAREDHSDEGKIMSGPDNLVTVMVDGWLLYESTALQIAQIYCLRQRLSSAILFKVANPNRALPPELGASVYAIACLFSFDGLSGISSTMELVGDVTPSSFLTSLIEPMPTRDTTSNESAKLRLLLEFQARFAVAEARRKEAEARRKEAEARLLKAQAQRKEAELKRKEAEARPVEAVGQPKEADTEPKKSKSKPKEADAKPKESESKPKKSKSKPKESDTKPKESKSKPKEADAKPKEADAKPKEADAKPKESDAKPKESDAKPKESDTKPKESEPKPKEAEPKPMEADAKPMEAEAKPMEAEGRPAEAEGEHKVMGPPGTPSKVSSSMTQEADKQASAPVKSKSTRKRCKKRVSSGSEESQPIQASSTAAALGVDTSSIVNSSMTQEADDKQASAPVESKSTRKRRKKQVNSRCEESQPIQASPVVEARAGLMLVDQLAPSSEPTSGTSEHVKQPLAPMKSKSRKRRRKQTSNNGEESHPIQASSIVAAGAESMLVDPLVAAN